jgi:catechol 2,3-dioxygenase-like lactoylglutathione lyase family enzyme
VTVELEAVVLDAVDPIALGAFWAHALGWAATPVDGGVELRPDPATDPTTFTLRLRPGAQPKHGQNRHHLDLTTTSADDQRAFVADLLAHGATPVDIGQRADDPHVVLADPEGNELCVIEPSNRFLAGCPRLGAVNLDGTAALGRFYADALGWPLVWDQDEETAVQHPAGAGPKVTWSGPPLRPAPGTDRFHLHVVPTPAAGEDPAAAALAHLLALGATRRAAEACRGTIALADVDGNAVCLRTS